MYNYDCVRLLTAITSGAQIGLDLGLDTVTTGWVEPSLFPTLWQVRMVREGQQKGASVTAR